jgi:hypothetical protein
VYDVHHVNGESLFVDLVIIDYLERAREVRTV